MISHSNHVRISATGGVGTCIAIDAPVRGVLNRFVAKQASGVSVDFVMEIYEKEGACPGTTANSLYSISGDDPQLTDPVYRVTPAAGITATAGNEAGFYDKWYGYHNRDWVKAVPNSVLYLYVLPQGTGAKTFDIGYTIWTTPSAA